MTTWIVTFSDGADSGYIDIEIQDYTYQELLDEIDCADRQLVWNDIDIDGVAIPRGYSHRTFRKKRGGTQPGAGAPKGTKRAGTYGTGVKTKPVRVPEEYAESLPELISNLEHLKELLNDWQRLADGSTSPRYDRARKLISEIKALGF